MSKIVIAVLALSVVSGCEQLPILKDKPWQRKPAPITQVAAQPEAEVVVPTPEVAQPTTDVVTAPSPVSSGFLGKTVASLGDPAKDGFWIETPLVTVAGKGRVRYPKSGREVKVDLIPITGPATGGSWLSLAVMRLLGAPLTALPEVEVYSD